MSEPAVKDIAPVRAVTESFTGSYNQTGAVLDELMAWLLQTGHPYSKKPFAIYYDDPAKVAEDKLRAEVCLSVEEKMDNYGRFEYKEIAGGTFASLVYTGPYSGIPAQYDILFEWIRDNGYKFVSEMGTREVFRKILGEVDSADELVTEILAPVQPVA